MSPLRALVLGAVLVGCGAVAPSPRYTDPAARQRTRLLEDLQRRQRADRTRLLQVVHAYLGIPYRWGGTTREGMDCSALVRAVYRQTYGIELPRTSRQMYELGQGVPGREQLRVGDLVFFRDPSSGPGVSHVGIFIGQGRFAHARPRRGSTITSLSDRFYARHYVGARRIVR
jgi:cell wall-associated NlpC family hydrolase